MRWQKLGRVTEGEHAIAAEAAAPVVRASDASTEAPGNQPAASDLASPSRRVDLLIVEDDANDLELALRVLSQLGLADRVRVARDGAEALSALLPSPDGAATDLARPRLVLLDLKLPRFSGLEVLRRIKAHPATRNLPVVVMTSSALDSDIATSFELGANSYVVKPVDFDGFAEAIRQIARYWLLLNAPSGTAGQ
jgi:two-component system response regulator